MPRIPALGCESFCTPFAFADSMGHEPAIVVVISLLTDDLRTRCVAVCLYPLGEASSSPRVPTPRLGCRSQNAVVSQHSTSGDLQFRRYCDVAASSLVCQAVTGEDRCGSRPSTVWELEARPSCPVAGPLPSKRAGRACVSCALRGALAMQNLKRTPPVSRPCRRRPPYCTESTSYWSLVARRPTGSGSSWGK
jgi:hypothetical protein